MNRKSINRHRYPLSLRFLAMMLALSMMLTSSGFQVLAEEAMTESQTDSAAVQQAAEEEEARQAAEAAAAQQAAEEEAARQAAEAAAAQQAAEEEAARQAAEAAAAQQAAEEEAARQAAEAAAARQAAEDAEAARLQQQAEAGTQQTAGTETSSSEEKVPVMAGRLVLKVDAVSVQEPGAPAKLKAEYGLGAECPLASVETRLYVWNSNVQFPQFVNGVYTDVKSGRTFTVKKDSEGDLYIEYILKAGESFSQEFQFTDSSVEPGTSVTFDAVICAIGEIPTDNSIQTTPGKVTYALPAAVTDVPEEAEESELIPVESEAPEESEETPESTESEKAPESAEENETAETVAAHAVAFYVSEGAAVTVDGEDVTNATALAQNGTIVFCVTAAEGYEITEILADITTPVKSTGNDGEYMIENIADDQTVVTVTAQALETETEAGTESETEIESETETETEIESETETETESETETETEIEYGTELTYSDGNVTVKAVAALEAKIPADAQLRAEPILPGTSEYNKAVALAEDHMEIREGYRAEYALYDVYFLADGKEIEPAEGLVTVTMEFAAPVFDDVEEVGEEYSVLHISDNNVVSDVTDSINVNGDGSVEAVGFSTDSFSTVMIVEEVKLSVASLGAESTNFADYIDSVNLITSDGKGYDAANPTADNGWVTLEMTFSEISGVRQFPVDTPLTYDMTNGGSIPLKGFNTETGNIVDSNGLKD